ncbi:tryptophanyl-tRNA synthetase, putative [Bodo saltans]|uniref:tryptophan--tRNA ligase n=1 Tax=Bodo saltans TaxID=75058 RepID=A0A0S4JC70_BODSA|nr:tryptophanyl-tRNA synthetase, putative [Bodo saltans]|eukprot:CUG89126.1 tryptophanyl-tRNA synthetase, putative [Bodo saltans]
MKSLRLLPSPSAFRQCTTYARGFCPPCPILVTSRRCCSSSSVTTASPSESVDDVVTPWAVEAKGPKGIDYDRVLSQFKSERIDAEMLMRLEKVIAQRHQELGRGGAPPPLHPLIRRGMVFSHRDLNVVLDSLEKKQTVYLYTGRGPSAGTMHVGHMVPFLLTKYLQDVLGCPLVIQLTDDEKFLFRDIPLGPKMDAIVQSNLKDIIAFGFDPKRTFIFRNTAYMGEMYSTVLELQRCITTNAAKNTFGFVDTDCIGKVAFPATQAAPSFVSSFRNVLPIKSHNMRCLIPCAIDQDPFFVLTRNVSDRLKRPKPALLHTKFLPALKGATHKMSSSAESNGVVLLTDDLATIQRKLRKAFSGGGGTMEDLKNNGADLDTDVAYQFVRTFSADDALVASTGEGYRAGSLTSVDVKELAAKVLWDEILSHWQVRRAAITDETVTEFTSIRDILRASPSW